MPGRRLLAPTIVSTTLLAAGIIGAPALADGDPASDVLVSQDIFLPFGQPASSKQADQLAALTREADQAGHPIKVAIIAAPTDLGSVSSLYGRPSDYARFLSLELEFVTKAPILIVMPQGIGYARAGKSIPSQQLAALTTSSGPQGLLQTAIRAIDRLEPNVKPTPAPTHQASSPTRQPAQPQPSPPAAPSGNAITGPARPSESFGAEIANRFEVGARDPVVWAALGVAFAVVALTAAAVYLAVEWSMRRTPRR